MRLRIELAAVKFYPSSTSKYRSGHGVPRTNCGIAMSLQEVHSIQCYPTPRLSSLDILQKQDGNPALLVPARGSSATTPEVPPTFLRGGRHNLIENVIPRYSP
ncbi:hypothetical protein VTO73DRAFT_2116 [Trametes versicolor]